MRNFIYPFQISPKDSRTLKFCNSDRDIPDVTKEYEVDRDRNKYRDELETEQVAWVWIIFFAYMAPEVQSFVRSLRQIVFKSWAKPSFGDFAFVAAMELTSTIGTYVPWPWPWPCMHACMHACSVNCAGRTDSTCTYSTYAAYRK